MMKIPSSTWRSTISFLLKLYLMAFPLPSADFFTKTRCEGYVTAEPAGVILLGSDVTLYCHISGIRSAKWNTLSLLLDQHLMGPGVNINFTTTAFQLTSLHSPKTGVICQQLWNGLQRFVCGLDLTGGLPPDKPTEVICETPQDSGLLSCWWNRGQETHLPTSYNVSLASSNGTQIHHIHVQRNNVTVPQTLLDEKECYQLTITAHNAMGASMSDPFKFCVKDVVVPKVPLIEHIEFANGSADVTVRCHRPDPSHWLVYVSRHRPGNSSSLLLGQGPCVGVGLVRLEGLDALTEYEFQARACCPPEASRRSTPPRTRCSPWSPAVRRVSPGRAPSQDLQVWRKLGPQDSRGLQNVTVLWKPPPPEESSDGRLRYEVLLDNHQVASCPPAGSPCVIQVSPHVRTLHVVAANSYGRSLPAAVHIRPSAVPRPAVVRPRPSGNGGVLLAWSPPPFVLGDALLGYVTEWTSGPADLQWHTHSRVQNTTFITGLTAGVRYTFSVYTVTSTGLSEPSSALGYSEDQISGPSSGPLWSGLDCPEHLRLILSLSAANPAGKGLRALPTKTHPARALTPPAHILFNGPLVGLVMVLLLFCSVAVSVFVFWKSVRKRIKQSCISWGPSWLVENVPKPEESKANTLLKVTDLEPPTEASWPTSCSDPPLSAIEEIPQEHTNLLPTGQTGDPGAWPPLTAGLDRTLPTEEPVETVSYKPHVPYVEEERDAPDTPAREQGSGGSVMLGEFPRIRLLWAMDGDFPSLVSLGFNQSSGISSVLFEPDDPGPVCAAGSSAGEEGDP